MKTLLLITPPEQQTLCEAGDRLSLGVFYIAAAAEKAGHKVIISDLNHDSYYELNRKIKKSKPDFIGMTTSTPYYDWFVNYANHLKFRYPNIKLIAGGPHATVAPESLKDIFDYIVIGDGEKAIVKILEGTNEQFILGETIYDMDTISYPARHLVDMSKYGISQFGKRTATIMGSRACPYNCFFCTSKSISGQKFRTHSVKYIIDEMQMLKEEYGFNSFHFLDDCFTFDMERSKEFARELIKRNLNVDYRVTTRTDRIDEEMIKLMKESGMTYITFGLEHFSDEVLKKIQKGNNIQKTIDAINLCHKYGIKIRGSFIVNLPGATKETMYATLNFAKKVNLDFADFWPLIAFPGTQLWNDPDKYGLKILSRNFGAYSTSGKSNVELIGMPNEEVEAIVADIRNKWKEFKGTRVPWES